MRPTASVERVKLVHVLWYHGARRRATGTLLAERLLVATAVGGRLRRGAIELVQAAVRQPAARSLSHHLPFTSRQFGPPRSELSNGDYARRSGAGIVELEDAEWPQRPPPLYVGPNRDLFLGRVSAFVPASSVLTLRAARVVGPHGWIIGAPDTFLSETSWFRGDSSTCGVHDLLRVRPTRRLEGRTVSLASDWASSNYLHFLLDAVPRLGLLEAAGVPISAADHVIVPDLPSRTGREILERLDLPAAKAIALSTLGIVECEELVVTSYPGIRRTITRRQTSFVRQRLVPEVAARGRRIYVSRGDRARRRLANEAEITSVLERSGFEVYTPGRGVDDLRTFAEAAIVVGAHGAGLANLAACAAGTAVIELLPDGHLYPYFYTLATSIGCSYACIVGQGGEHPRTDPFWVDAHKFETVFEQVVG
jgi:capsular polysaccharide biosynthesis protein